MRMALGRRLREARTVHLSTQPLREAVEQAIAQGNWYAALMTTLTLPDIIGRIEDPTTSSSARYIDWFDRFVGARYSATVGRDPQPTVFLTGADCYALRCALLHEGSDSILRQRARSSLEAFRFVAPRPGRIVHNNRIRDTLLVQVDIFCRDVIAGVASWEHMLPSMAVDIQKRATELFRIETGSYTI